MSIPTKVLVHRPDGEIIPTRISTISYGRDTRLRETWLNHVKQLSDPQYPTTQEKIKWFPWILDFDYIEVDSKYNDCAQFRFERWEVISKEQEERLKNDSSTFSPGGDPGLGGQIQECERSE